MDNGNYATDPQGMSELNKIMAIITACCFALYE